MFKFFKRASKPAPAPAVCDIPSHKGFRATVTLPSGRKLIKAFQTLKQAQVWIQKFKAQALSAARAFGRSTPASHTYTIQNLETGKFAPFRWVLTRAEIA